MKRADIVITPNNTPKIPTHIYFFTSEGFHTDGVLGALAGPLSTLRIKPGDKKIAGFDNVNSISRVYAVGLGKKDLVTPLTVKNAMAGVVRRLHKRGIEEIAVHIPPELSESPYETGKAVATGLHLGNYRFLKYKSREARDESRAITKCTLIASVYSTKQLGKFEEGIQEAGLISDAVTFARDLVNDPANNARPAQLADEAKKIAAASHGMISVKILDTKQCKTLGMGAYLGVAQGSAEAPMFIVMHYAPRKKTDKSAALIGKSITFDSGGLSLKPADSMMDMKIDMSGGATVLGIFSALAELECPVEVWGILPACENMPSGTAQRPGDVVTAMNGTSIEVLNTDAEGRLTLADALSYAEAKLKPDYIIDIATLTGACMVALGGDLAGVFGNNYEFKTQYLRCAAEEGDEAWDMPLHKPYLKKMKSDIADLKNIGGGKYGGAITAALFLSEFVKKAKWIHIDFAGPAYRDESKGANPKGASGWGVQSIIALLRTLH